MLENKNKQILVYAEVQESKLKEFKKLFPFAFEIKDVDKLKEFKEIK